MEVTLRQNFLQRAPPIRRQKKNQGEIKEGRIMQCQKKGRQQKQNKSRIWKFTKIHNPHLLPDSTPINLKVQTQTYFLFLIRYSSFVMIEILKMLTFHITWIIIY